MLENTFAVGPKEDVKKRFGLASALERLVKEMVVK